MLISAHLKNSPSSHEVFVATAGVSKPVAIPGKKDAKGSSVSGGEFLMLALATCYCNDLYREAARLGIAISGVEVEARAQFKGIGLAASNIEYSAKVQSDASPEKIAQLMMETDAVAEIHNTIRSAVGVELVSWT
jgi:uncharacterized OsmC-like protein